MSQKNTIRFTKGSSQIKVISTATKNMYDLEELSLAQTHKKYSSPLTILFGEYCQIQKFHDRYITHQLFKLTNLMKYNTLTFVDAYTREEFTIEPIITSDQQDTRYRIGDMFLNKSANYHVLKKYLKILVATFGEVEVTYNEDGTPDCNAILARFMSRNKEAADRVASVANQVRSLQASYFGVLQEYFIQARMEHDLIDETEHQLKELKDFMELIELSDEELNSYQYHGVYTQNIIDVPNYGVSHRFEGVGTNSRYAGSYKTLYKNNKKASTSAHQLQARLAEYVADVGYGLYEPTRDDKMDELNQLKTLAEHNQLSDADTERMLDLEAELESEIIYIGSLPVLDSVVTTRSLITDDEESKYTTYQETEEEDRARPEMTQTLSYDIDTNKSNAIAFDNMIKRQHASK